jgi:fructosamine-3-kinase
MEIEEIAEEVVEKEFPNREAEDVYSAEEGFAHDTFFVDFEDDSFVLKINGLDDLVEKQDQDWSARFETEPYVLDLIQRETDVSVPECVARDASKNVIPEYYHILRKMKGYSPSNHSSRTSFSDLNEGRKMNILQQLGKSIARFHQIEFDSFGELRVENQKLTVEEKKGWPELFQDMISFWVQKIEGGRFDDLIPEIKEVVDNKLSLLEEVETSVLVHREIDCKNILIDNEELVGILDWESCIAGHNEFDLVTAEGRILAHNFNDDSEWEKYRKKLYQSYQDTNELEIGWKERRQLYLLYPLILEMFFYSEHSPNTEKLIKERTRKILDSSHPL